MFHYSSQSCHIHACFNQSKPKCRQGEEVCMDISKGEEFVWTWDLQSLCSPIVWVSVAAFPVTQISCRFTHVHEEKIHLFIHSFIHRYFMQPPPSPTWLSPSLHPPNWTHPSTHLIKPLPPRTLLNLPWLHPPDWAPLPPISLSPSSHPPDWAPPFAPSLNV